MTRSRRHWWMVVVLSLCWLSLPVAAEKRPGSQRPQALAETLGGTPLQVTVYANTQVAVRYNGQPQFYADTASGIFLTINGRIYGPNTIPAGATPNWTPYTEISNTQIDNTIVTVVEAGSSGLRLTVITSYNAGQSSYRSEMRITNTSLTTLRYRLSHAADFFPSLPGMSSDEALGYHNPLTGAVGAVSADGRLYQLFIPETRASAYQEGAYDLIWDHIGSFNNTIDPNLIDAGAGLEWERRIPPAATQAISDLVSFGPTDPSTLALPALPADVWGGIAATPNLAVRSGSVMSYRVHLKNWGRGRAQVIEMRLPYDTKLLTLIDAEFERPETFVSENTPGLVVVRSDQLAPGTSTTGLLRFAINGAAGSVLDLQPALRWADSAGGFGAADHQRLGNRVTPMIAAANRSGEIGAHVAQGAGQLVITGSDFAPFEPVDLWFDRDGVAVPVGRVWTSATGRMRLLWSIRGRALGPGTHRLVARGVYSYAEQVATLRID